ncbi:MAG: hypothetical protein HUJ68_11415 [Clostridia bacterium]|nr:hypothetical protein [Clostridia bacterium]
MLFILLGIAGSVLILGLLSYKLTGFDSFTRDVLTVFGATVTLILVIVLLSVLGIYNSTKATSSKKIAVLEQRNTEAIEQIEPLVEKYLDYEKTTFAGLKLDVNTVVAMSAYPELKGNEFVQSQINIIMENQREITALRLSQANLEAYRLWIFMGE